VADRVAQTVVAMYLEPKVEPAFHPDSYGYRPKRSALDAVGRCRERALLTFLWVGFHDRPGSAGQRPPRVRSAMAISASGLW
jgi:hypothetical protein